MTMIIFTSALAQECKRIFTNNFSVSKFHLTFWTLITRQMPTLLPCASFFRVLQALPSCCAHCLTIRYPIFRAWFRCEALGSQGAGTAPDLKAAVSTVCGDLGVPAELLAPGYVEEIQRSWDHARGGPVEITTVASVIGGIAANEAVKHIVQKFQPLNNSAIYDGANLEFCVDFKM